VKSRWISLQVSGSSPPLGGMAGVFIGADDGEDSVGDHDQGCADVHGVAREVSVLLELFCVETDPERRQRVAKLYAFTFEQEAQPTPAASSTPRRGCRSVPALFTSSQMGPEPPCPLAMQVPTVRIVTSLDRQR
jgi:hypothetical protein